MRRRHQFHDVRLSDAVRCARQALAVDEPRMKFEPCLWDAMDPVSGTEDERVRQVWFEGCHSDIGGGYAETGLSDTALLWMVAEANKQGLVFDEVLLREYLGASSSAIRHDPSKLLFRLLDVAIRARILLRRHDGRAFLGAHRRLHRPDCVSVRVAECTADHYRGGTDYRPPNLVSWAGACDDFAECIEPVIGLPEPSYESLVERLARLGVRLGGARRPTVASMPAQGPPTPTTTSAAAS
jgi:hypothetical protein